MMSAAMVALVMLAGALDDHPAFHEGRRLYEESEYEQATFRFQEAALDPSIVAPSEKAQIFMWLGLAYAGFGNAESARRAFRDALRLDENVAVPIEISPKVEAEIAAVRDEVRADKEAARAREEAARKAKDEEAARAAHAASASSGTSWVLPVVVGAAGAACLIGSVVSASLAMASHEQASDLETFQDEVPALVATRDTQAAIAVGIGGIGAALVGGAAFFAFTAE